jgi:hypothetical protein
MGRSKRMQPINPYKFQEERLNKFIKEFKEEDASQQEMIQYQLAKVQLNGIHKQKHDYNQSLWRQFQNHGKKMVGRKKGRKARL